MFGKKPDCQGEYTDTAVNSIHGFYKEKQGGTRDGKGDELERGNGTASEGGFRDAGKHG